MRRRIVTAIVVVGCLALSLGPGAASGDTPRHRRTETDFRISYRCPGPDARERANVATHSIRYPVRDGVRMTITHTRWRGWIRGAEGRIRDDGTWTIMTYRRDGEVFKTVTVGTIWHVTIPGEGIIVHQSGRRVDHRRGDPFLTTFADFADSRPICRYI